MVSTRVLQDASAPRSPETVRTDFFTTTLSPRKQFMITQPLGTPRTNRSPIRKRTLGITAVQRQALIENLQLEVTERARRLRSQYNIQAQSLRTRVEIRVNRIPISLRKMTMAELLQRHVQQQERSAQIASRIAAGHTRTTAPVLRPGMKAVPSLSASQTSPRRFKRTSDVMSGDKENNDAPAQVAQLENPKKRARGPTVTSADNNGPVLSPTSNNQRDPRSRPVSPVKVSASRSVSPVKTSRPNVFSNMVEKAKTTRAAMSRKANTASSATTTLVVPPSTSRSRRGVVPAPAPTPSRTRRVSGESDSSSSTIARKPGSRPGTAMSKSSTSSARGKTTMASKKAAMAKATATPKEAPKRVLRSRAA